MDRNCGCLGRCLCWVLSLSARRAWIEILIIKLIMAGGRVALRKESVDRNPYLTNYHFTLLVALRKESVDRNVCSKLLEMLILGRSPQGERG